MFKIEIKVPLDWTNAQAKHVRIKITPKTDSAWDQVKYRLGSGDWVEIKEHFTLLDGYSYYDLEVTAGEVKITARTLQGVRYALYSLRQMAIPQRGTLQVEGWILPQVTIHDKPSLDFRGIHMCWFHESKPWEIERLIRLAAYYKLNYAVVESWGSFRSDVAPWYGWPDGSMTKKELKRLRKIADDLGITLIPQINVFGHATMSRGGAGKHAALEFNPQYQPLFEPVNGWNWCLSNPETRKLLQDLIVEQLEAYGNPPYFHIGCDEALPPSCPACKKNHTPNSFWNMSRP